MGVSGSLPARSIAVSVSRCSVRWWTYSTTRVTSGRSRPAEAAAARSRGNIGLIPAGNLAGLPAIFFPCGLGTDGLPVGLQLVGPPFSEPLLVALAEAYQRETDHHLLRPPTS